MRHPYVPARVYKALLKIAILALPEEDVCEYDQAIADLKANIDRKGSNSRLVNIWVNPGPPFPTPFAFLCKKKDETTRMLTHTFILYFQNYIYQIFLPAYRKDFWMYDGKMPLTFIGSPPLIDERWAEHYGYPEFHRIDMSSSDLVRNDNQVITLTFDSSTESGQQSDLPNIVP